MIVTERYLISSKLRKIPLGSAFLRLLLARVASMIAAEPPSQTVLTNDAVAALLKDVAGLSPVDSGTLFNLYFTKVDPDALADLCNGFLSEVERLHGENLGLPRLKAYFFAMLSDHWCQLVEFARSPAETEGVTLIGEAQSAEALVLAKLAGDGKFRVKRSLTDFVLRALSRLTARAKIREATSPKLFMDNYSRVRSAPAAKPAGVIVVNVLEERRFGRLAELKRELESTGLEMVLYCAAPKPETLRGLEKFPELKARLLTGAALIEPAEAEELFLRTQASLKALCASIKQQGIAGKFTYHGVPLLQAAWEEVEQIFLQRGPELAVNAALIERALAAYPVKAFLGVDNGTATSAWVTAASDRGLPSFFHFYNALRSTLSYRFLWECLKPTAWILGSERQAKFFRDSGAPGDQRFLVSGDMFADTVVRCDREKIASEIRRKAGMADTDKVVMLLSAYVIADFTVQTKKTLFQGVARATNALGARLIVKAHPNERLDVLRDQMSGWGIHAPVFHHESIRDVLLAADLACMYASEAAQQAMLAGVPVIAILPDQIRNEMDQHFDYFSTGAVATVTLGKDPTPLMREILLEGEGRRAQINRGYAHAEATLGQRDGRNAERFAGYVTELLAR